MDAIINQYNLLCQISIIQTYIPILIINIILTNLLKFREKSEHMVFKRKTQLLSEGKRNVSSWWDNECTTSSKKRKPAIKNYSHMNFGNFIKNAEAKSIQTKMLG